MTVEAQPRSNRLPIIAAGINDHLIAAETATRRGLEHAIAAGMLLLEAKELVGMHGDWLAWLQANCRTGPRQAQTCMRLARNRHKLEAIKNESTAHLTIAAAEALIGRPRPERPHGLPGQLDMLGGEEVIAHAPALRGRALFDLIVDLEQALAVITREAAYVGANGGWGRAKRLRRAARLRAVASIISTTIAYLKTQRRRQQRAPR